MPGIARPRAEGGYEIIAGHRRKHGCELAGLSTMPMFIRDYNDDEATVIMVDTNIQREDILPSEKGRAHWSACPFLISKIKIILLYCKKTFKMHVYFYVLYLSLDSIFDRDIHSVRIAEPLM